MQKSGAELPANGGGHSNVAALAAAPSQGEQGFHTPPRHVSTASLMGLAKSSALNHCPPHRKQVRDRARRPQQVVESLFLTYTSPR